MISIFLRLRLSLKPQHLNILNCDCDKAFFSATNVDPVAPLELLLEPPPEPSPSPSAFRPPSAPGVAPELAPSRSPKSIQTKHRPRSTKAPTTIWGNAPSTSALASILSRFAVAVVARGGADLVAGA
jgi:hypothetical protein